MITDEMLRQAAEEAALAINEHLPSPEECHHDFSPGFKKKILKLDRKVKHPVFYKITKIVACFLLIFIIGTTSILTFSPEVRAAVFGWFRSVCESFYEYGFEGTPSEEKNIEYKLEWIPDGYTLTSRETIAGNTDAWYEDKTNDQILFSYTSATNDTGLYVESEGAIHSTVDISGNQADLYISEDQTGRNIIVWIDAKTDTLLFINGHLSEDELIKMAKSVITE